MNLLSTLSKLSTLTIILLALTACGGGGSSTDGTSPKQPPTDDSTETPPTDDNTETPPTDDNTETPPTDDNTETPPTDDSTETPPTDTPTVVLQGQFIGSPVSGMAYSTASQSGSTDANGTFNYIAGETIRFSIGDLTSFEIPAKQYITVFDLNPLAEPITDREKLVEAIAYDKNYQHVVNMAVFLQTLDDDAITANGIQLSPKVISFFTDFSFEDYPLNFIGSTYDFDIEFNQIIKLMNQEGIFKDARSVLFPAQAMAQLYSNLSGVAGPSGLSSEIITRTSDNKTIYTRELDYNETGLILRDKSKFESDIGSDNLVLTNYYSDYLYIATYDYRNYLTNYSKDSGIDGFLNETLEKIYNVDGSLEKTILKLDYDDDNIIDTRSETIFDSVGRVIRSSTYDEGTDNLNEEYTTAYDDRGNTIRETEAFDIYNNETQRTFYDNNILKSETVISYDEGNEDYRLESIYNQQGKLLTFKTYDDGSSIPTATVEYTYNTQGYVTLYKIESSDEFDSNYTVAIEYYSNNLEKERLIDDNNDGIYDERTYYEYDSNANLILRTQDSNLSDQLIDREEAWVYDSQNRNTEESTKYNGFLSSTTNYIYNSNGSEETRYASYNEAGEIDYRYIYRYDSNGNQTYKAHFSGEADTTKTSEYKKDYDNDGFLIYESRDTNGEGLLYFELTTSRDSNNNYIIVANSYDESGAITGQSTYHYNSNKTQTYYASDSDYDGNLDKIYEWLYDGNQLIQESRSAYNQADGTYDVSSNYYNSNGYLIRSEHDGNYIKGGDNIFESYNNYLYDDNNNLTRLEEEITGDNIVDRVSVMTYVKSANWNKIFEEASNLLSLNQY